jgi:hypothetical protein
MILHSQIVEARKARAFPPRSHDNPARMLALRAGHFYYQYTCSPPTFVWDDLAAGVRGDYRGQFVEWLEALVGIVAPLGTVYAHTRQSLVGHAKRAFGEWLRANQENQPDLFPNLESLLAAVDALRDGSTQAKGQFRNRR